MTHPSMALARDAARRRTRAKMWTTLAALLALVGAGCARRASVAPAPEPAVFEFAWAPGTTAVVQTRRKHVGTEAASETTLRFKQVVAKVEGGLSVGQEHVEVESEDSAPQPEGVQAFALTRTVVAPDGSFVRAEGVDEAVTAMLAPIAPSLDPAERDALRAQVAPLLEAELRDGWNLLVGYWRGARIARGEVRRLQGQLSFPLLGNDPVAVEIDVESAGPVPCPSEPGPMRCVQATLRAVPSAEESARIVGALQRMLLEASPRGSTPILREQFVEETATLLTEPAGMHPHRLERRRTIRFAWVGADGVAQSHETVEETVSEWVAR